MKRDHKQAIAIMVIKLTVSQNSSELLHQMRNCQLVEIVSVCSFNHSSTAVSISLYVAAFLHLLQQLCENAFKTDDDDNDDGDDCNDDYDVT
jgi:hypothetical protein